MTTIYDQRKHVCNIYGSSVRSLQQLTLKPDEFNLWVPFSQFHTQGAKQKQDKPIPDFLTATLCIIYSAQYS